MAPVAFRTRLARRASRAGLSLSPGLSEKLIAYYELLERWNRKINLTALDEPDNAIDRLLLEPVVAARYLPLSRSGISLMDVGAGGGSPALPMTMAAPQPVDLTMVEAKVRKSAFLREAIRHLGLTGARVENARFEEAAIIRPGPEATEIILVDLRRLLVDGERRIDQYLRPNDVVYVPRTGIGNWNALLAKLRPTLEFLALPLQPVFTIKALDNQ